MSLQKKLQLRRKRRSFRTRNKLMSKGLKPRVSVFKSAKHIYAQVIDDAVGTTLVSFSSLQLKDTGKPEKKSIAKLVGQKLGNTATKKGIDNVFFDRGRFSYHGRIKALADGLREAGLKF